MTTQCESFSSPLISIFEFLFNVITMTAQCDARFDLLSAYLIFSVLNCCLIRDLYVKSLTSSE